MRYGGQCVMISLDPMTLLLSVDSWDFHDMVSWLPCLSLKLKNH